MGNKINKTGRITDDRTMLLKKDEPLWVVVLVYIGKHFNFHSHSIIAEHRDSYSSTWSHEHCEDTLGERSHITGERTTSQQKVQQTDESTKKQTGKYHESVSDVPKTDTVRSGSPSQEADCKMSQTGVKHEDAKGGACATEEVERVNQSTPQNFDNTSQARNHHSRSGFCGWLQRICFFHESGKDSLRSSFKVQGPDLAKELSRSQHAEDTREECQFLHKIINQLQRTLEEKEKEIQEKDHIIRQQEKELENCYEEFKKLRPLKETLKRKEEQIKDLTNRLASEMGTKVAADESSLENINIKDRPMNIASEYELLCSNEWLVAKTELDEQEKLTEEISLQFLCDTLVIGLTEATKMKKLVMHGVGTVLSKPGITAIDDAKVPGCFSLSEKLMQNFMDLQRQTVDETDLTRLYESIIKVLKSHSKNKDIYYQGMLESAEMVEYIKSVAVFTWKMVLQRPPMSFRLHGIGGHWQGETKQEVFWSSSDPSDPDSRVAYYVHPALYHGEAMMVKGRVFLSNKGLQDGQ